MATPFKPEESCSLLKKAGYKVIPTGLKHGTMTILLPSNRHIELTTFRQDIETDGRHAIVSFTQNMYLDAKRRDLTINALYMDKNGQIYDFFHGISDLKRKKIRFIGNAQDRILEDSLRILRFFRFWGQFGKKNIPLKTLKTCQKLAPLLETLSKERKTEELFKILCLPDAPFILRFMDKYHILNYLLHIQPKAIAHLYHFIQLEKKYKKTFSPISKLALITDSYENLMLSNAQKKEFNSLRKVILSNFSTYSHRQKIAYLYSKETAETAFYMQYASAKRFLSTPLAREWQKMKVPLFPITAQDLIEMGIPPGPQVGKKLKEAEEIWFQLNYTPKKELVLNKLKR